MSGTTDLNDTTPVSGVPPEIFRAYDIRGIYGTQLNEQNIELIGQGIGSEALSLGIDTLLIGRDGRLSSPSLSKRLISGVRASGCNIVDLGVIPTPLLYFATHTTHWKSGIMLTASHNPAAYNGIKIVFNRSCLAADQIQKIRHRVESGKLSTGHGRYQEQDIKPDYIKDICRRIRLEKKLKIIIDCGNGVAGVVAGELFETLGCEVIPLFCDLDGSFPNHDPDPTQVKNLNVLRTRLLGSKADIGLAFDGDGDRVVVVDNDGEAIDTDRLLATLIKSIVPDHPGGPVIFDVKCSSRLAPLIREYGGEPVMHRSGHSFMKQKMQETGAALGGEFSAHIFIKDRWFGFDDGLYTGARLLEILSQSEVTSADLFGNLGERYATPELKIEVKDSEKFSLARKISELADFPDGKITDIDGLRVDFNDGWGLVRPSNTSPALLLRFEADSPQSLTKIQARFKQLILQADGSLPIGF
ncbi:MAG: phosphomannomutase/phosphoglucomutase [Gammaproteobacteria bacterium]|nr:phosphomannomutase/phosphoglucomutase [Gammaproteobacteria bacterium]